MVVMIMPVVVEVVVSGDRGGDLCSHPPGAMPAQGPKRTKEEGLRGGLHPKKEGLRGSQRVSWSELAYRRIDNWAVSVPSLPEGP